MKHAMLPSASAAATPEQVSFQQLAVVNQELRHKEQQRSQALDSSRDEPGGGGRG